MDDNHAVTSNGRHVQPYLEVTRQNTSTRLSTMQNIGLKNVEKKKKKTVQASVVRMNAHDLQWDLHGSFTNLSKK
jgi:hypothetical protein